MNTWSLPLLPGIRVARHPKALSSFIPRPLNFLSSRLTAILSGSFAGIIALILAPCFAQAQLFADGQAQYADLNGDGKADLIFQGQDNTFWVSLFTGTAFTSPTLWIVHGGLFVNGQAQYADLNGDAKADLIFQGLDNTFWVSLSTGNGSTPPTLWMQHGGSYVKGQAQYVDVDGDGKADLLFQSLDNDFWISLSTGTGFMAPSSTGTGFIPTPCNGCWDY